MAKRRIKTPAYIHNLDYNSLPTLITKDQLNTIITNKDGTPDFLAINILWDSLRSWFSPMKQHRSDGNVIQIKKLKTQGVYVSAEQLSKTHGVSKRTTTRKLAKLESLGFIQRSFRHKQTSTTKSYNQRCIYVLKHTPYFFNPHGIDREEIKEITPQTNANYIEEKFNVVFASKIKQTKALRIRGGIDTCVSTKELREPFNKLKDRSNESNFLENSNSVILQLETSNFVETKNEVVSEEGGEEATIRLLKPNNPHQSARPANQRKKSTNAGYKAKRGRVYHFKQYDEPKNLADHYPLSAEDVSLLQSKSGREFDLNAQNQILLALSKKPKQQEHTFPSKASFIAYMSKVLASEKRNAVQVNNTGFRINANLTAKDITERANSTKIESYLSEVENKAITNRSDETQFRAKLVGALGDRAYNILPHLVSIKAKEAVFELHLNKELELTEQIKCSILKEANAVDGYKGVESLKFVSPEKEISIEEWSRTDDTTTPSSTSRQPKSLELPQGVWGQVSKELVAEYGVDIYKHWFSKLTTTVDENVKTIELKASSEFVKDWIVDKYENQLRKITNNLNIEFLGVCS